jgi:hypothetical protein
MFLLFLILEENKTNEYLWGGGARCGEFLIVGWLCFFIREGIVQDYSMPCSWVDRVHFFYGIRQFRPTNLHLRWLIYFFCFGKPRVSLFYP